MRRDTAVEQKYFEDLSIGEVYSIPSKTVTETHFVLFSALSGDTHPIHMSESYAREQTEFSGRVAHGMLNAVFTVVGASSLSRHIEETTVAFLGQSSTFLEPVYIGDTVYPELEIVDKHPQETTGIVDFQSRLFNQDDQQVLEGELELLIERRPEARQENGG